MAYKHKFILATLAAGTIAIGGCKKDAAPQSGAFPVLETAPYEPPQNMEAHRAYIEGFKGRYDRPILEYPTEIKERVQAARMKRLKKDAKLAEMNMNLAKAALESKKVGSIYGYNQSLSDELLSDLNNNSFDNIANGSMDKFSLMMELAGSRKKKEKLPPSHPESIREYENALRSYPGRVATYTVENCKWDENKDLVNSGRKEMSKVYDEWPSHGYYCQTTAGIRTDTGYVRESDGSGVFVKSQKTGQWLYYGTYPRVNVKPRRIELNAQILKNPERAIRKLPFWEVDI